MTINLAIIGAVLLLAVGGCAGRPNGEGSNYFARGNSQHQDRDAGDRDYRGGPDGREHRNDQ
jgi:hypothetical protein